MSLQLSAVGGKRTNTASLRSRLRKDMQFFAFYLLPFMEDFREDTSWLAAAVNSTLERAEGWKRELLDAGLWSRGADGRLRPSQARLGLSEDGSAELDGAEFMTMSAQLLSKVAPTENCWYECHTVVTSVDVRRKFLARMHETLSQFLKESETAPGETMISWSHVALDSLKSLAQENEQ